MDITKLGAEELRVTTPTKKQFEKVKKTRKEIYIVLDNVLDTYNIGGIFRLADAVGAKKIFLCKDSETPPNHKIKKASVGTWQWVTWSYASTAADAIHELKSQNTKIKIVGIEQDKSSIPYDSFDYKLPIALVVGNETEGISNEVLELCDAIVDLPMAGINKSLNVIVSLAVVLYKAIEKNI